jgi:soluble lytic murein transglycosylase-like protein
VRYRAGMSPRSGLLLSSLLVLAVWPAQTRAGDIYVGTDSNGVVTFTDTPPPDLEGFEVFIRELDLDRPDDWASIDAGLLRQNLDSYDDIIVSSAAEYKLAPELVKAVVLVESGMNPRATSPRGAQGLMQLMPATAEELGVADSYAPLANVRGGAKYLRKMLNQFGGDRELALAAYNAGPGNVRKYDGIPPFEETQYYVRKVLRYYRWFLAERPMRRG